MWNVLYHSGTPCKTFSQNTEMMTRQPQWHNYYWLTETQHLLLLSIRVNFIHILFVWSSWIQTSPFLKTGQTNTMMWPMFNFNLHSCLSFYESMINSLKGFNATAFLFHTALWAPSWMGISSLLMITRIILSAPSDTIYLLSSLL